MEWYNNVRCTDGRRNNKGRFPRIALDTEKLLEQYHNFTPIADIAANFNCSVPTVKRNLRPLIPENLRRYKQFYSENNPVNQRMMKLYTNHHYSTLKIAGIVGLADETVRKRLKSLGIQMRGLGFKNLESFHPGKLRRRGSKEYPFKDVHEFNSKFREYYCLMYPQYKIAELLQIDRGTVRRRIRFLKEMYHFKTRFCKRCNNLFRFRVSEHIKNSKICGRCRKC